LTSERALFGFKAATLDRSTWYETSWK